MFESELAMLKEKEKPNLCLRTCCCNIISHMTHDHNREAIITVVSEEPVDLQEQWLF
jgi:hypothetical protein